MRRAMLAGAVVVALSACSSGAPALTKAEWVSKANAICTTYSQRFSSIPSDFGTRGSGE